MITRRNFFKSISTGAVALVAAPIVASTLSKAAPLGPSCPVGPPNPIFVSDEIHIDIPAYPDWEQRISEYRKAQIEWLVNAQEKVMFETLSGMK